MTESTERVEAAGALDRADFERAMAAGVALVVDLRDDGEPVPRGIVPHLEAELAARLGVPHARIPMPANRPGATAFAALGAALDRVHGPVIVHCASGRRAAVALVAVHGRVRGWTLGECADALRADGFDLDAMPLLREAVQDYLERDHAPAHVAGGGRAI